MNTKSQYNKDNQFSIRLTLRDYPILLKILCVITMLPIFAAPIVFYLSVFVFDDPNANIFAQFGIFLGVNSYSFLLIGICVLSVFFFAKYQNWIISTLPFAVLFLIVYGTLWYFNDGSINKDNVSPIDYRLFRETPCEGLAKAVQRENVKAIENILCGHPELGDYIEPQYHQAVIFQAIANKKYKSLETMLRCGANPNIVAYEKAGDPNHADTPLKYTCKKISFSDDECLKFVKLLLHYGADINSRNLTFSITPLGAATSLGRMNVVKYLLDNGADIDMFGQGNYQPLRAAIVFRHYDIAIELLKHNSNPDYRPFDNIETVREFLESSINGQRNYQPHDVSELKKILEYIHEQDKLKVK